MLTVISVSDIPSDYKGLVYIKKNATKYLTLKDIHNNVELKNNILSDIKNGIILDLPGYPRNKKDIIDKYNINISSYYTLYNAVKVGLTTPLTSSK